MWWDRIIPPGRQFDEVIEEALDSANCVVVLWSKASVSSTWVKTEAAEGMRRKILIPAFIEDVKLPLEFRRVQTADLSRWSGKASDSLLDSLLHSIENQVGPSAHSHGEAAAQSGPESPGENRDHSRADPSDLDDGRAQRSDSGKGKHSRALGAIAIAVVVVMGIVFVAYRRDESSGIETQEQARAKKAAVEKTEQERLPRSKALEGSSARVAIDASDVVATKMAGRWRTKTMAEKEELRITSKGRNVTVAELNAYGEPAATWKGVVTDGVFEGDYYFNAKKIGTAKLQLSDDGQMLSGTITLDPDSHLSYVYFRQ